MGEKRKIVVNEQGYLDVIDEEHPVTKETFKNMDLGQVIDTFRVFGYRYVREDDIDWLIKFDEDDEKVAYQKGEDDGG